MYEGSAQLEKAMRNLLIAWFQAKESWSDIKTSNFEERYIAPLQQDTRLATETMARMGTLLDQIRRDCSDRETV